MKKTNRPRKSLSLSKESIRLLSTARGGRMNIVDGPDSGCILGTCPSGFLRICQTDRKTA